MGLKSQFVVHKRLLALFMLIAFIFVTLFFRLFYIQIIQGRELQARALDQWTRDIPSVAKRGVIYDTNGIILADTTTQYTVYVRPVSVIDKEYTANVLATVLNLDRDKLLAKIVKGGVSEITVKKQVTKQEMQAIINAEPEGVYFSEDIKRYYPYSDFLTQILGFTNYDGLGQAGIESYYNHYLTGINGYQLTETDLIGNALNNNILYMPSIDGLNINLTIDYYIQALSESAVRDAVERYSAKSASCIVMNINTGEILSLAQAPSFDLNNVPRDNVVELFSNMKSYAISNVYEPGSTFKIITAAIGLETGIFTDSYNLYCPGYRLIDGQRIRCWRTTGHGSQDFGDGINNSCNCLFMDIATAVGTDTMYDYYNKFGLMTKTGIDMSGEASGLLIKQELVKNVDIARMGFGQAIAITPIELLVSSAAVINGGNMVTPYILNTVTDKNGKVILKNQPKIVSNIISAKTSREMRVYLESVVVDGSGKKAFINGYNIGGKTGTAQKYENGIIAQGKYLSSFIGFFDEYIAIMLVDEPQGYLYYGSMVAAPYIKDIFEGIINYKNIPPSTTMEEIVYYDMPYLIGMTTSEASVALKRAGIVYESEGVGIVQYQFPAPDTKITKKTVAFISLS